MCHATAQKSVGCAHLSRLVLCTHSGPVSSSTMALQIPSTRLGATASQVRTPCVRVPARPICAVPQQTRTVQSSAWSEPSTSVQRPCQRSHLALTPTPCGRLTHVCHATATETPAEAISNLSTSKALAAIIQYAIDFAKASETYEVNSWMLLMGILKFEQCTAAKTLQRMGIDDLYGAWHEVLWAMQAVDALETRPFVPEIGFADRAYHVLIGASRFAEWGGRTKVQSEDLLMALAAGAVLEGLFPDIKPTFSRVRQAVEQQAGGVYVLPDDDANTKRGGDDDFL